MRRDIIFPSHWRPRKRKHCWRDPQSGNSAIFILVFSPGICQHSQKSVLLPLCFARNIHLDGTQVKKVLVLKKSLNVAAGLSPAATHRNVVGRRRSESASRIFISRRCMGNLLQVLNRRADPILVVDSIEKLAKAIVRGREHFLVSKFVI